MKATSCPLLVKTPLGGKCCALGGFIFTLYMGGRCEQGFRRMAARNKPAGIRSLVYGMGKGKARIEGLSVLDQAEHDGFFGSFLAIAD